MTSSNSAMSSGKMGWLFARASFLPTLGLNLVLERITSRTWYNDVDATVVLGALPFRSMTKQLVEDVGVTAVVSMNEDYELRYLSNTKQEWEAAGVEFLQLSTTDIFEAPCQAKLKQGVEFITQHTRSSTAGSDGSEGSDRRVYVHCKAGRTRSATLVACYLMQKYGMNPTEAVTHMTAKRPHVWLGRQQHRAIEQYYNQHLKATR